MRRQSMVRHTAVLPLLLIAETRIRIALALQRGSTLPNHVAFQPVFHPSTSRARALSLPDSAKTWESCPQQSSHRHTGVSRWSVPALSTSRSRLMSTASGTQDSSDAEPRDKVGRPASWWQVSLSIHFFACPCHSPLISVLAAVHACERDVYASDLYIFLFALPQS